MSVVVAFVVEFVAVLVGGSAIRGLLRGLRGSTIRDDEPPPPLRLLRVEAPQQVIASTWRAAA